MKEKIWKRRGAIAWIAAAIAVTLVTVLTPFEMAARLSNDILIPVTFWCGIIFIIYYTLLARWWHNPMGRLIVGLDVAVVLITLDSVLISEFHVTIDNNIEIRLLVLALILSAVILLTRIFLLGWLHGWVPHWPWQHKHRQFSVSPEGEKGEEAAAPAPGE